MFLPRFRSWLAFIFLVPAPAFSQVSREKEQLARAYYQRALKSRNADSLAEAYYRLAKVEFVRMNRKKGNELLLNSIAILEKKTPSYELGRNYIWLSMNSSGYEDYEECFKMTDKALSIFNACNSDRGRMHVYSTYGNIHMRPWGGEGTPGFRPANYPKAVEFLKIAEHYALKINDKESLAMIRAHRGQMEAILNGTDRMIPAEEKYGLIREKEPTRESMNYTLDYGRNLIRNGKPEEGLAVVKSIEPVINEHFNDDPQLLQIKELAFSEYYRKKGDYKQALEHTERSYSHYTQALMEDRQGAISELQIRYETAKKEAELQKQQLELRINHEKLSARKDSMDMQQSEIRAKNDSILYHKWLLKEQLAVEKLKDENLLITRRFLGVAGGLLALTAVLALTLFYLFRKSRKISRRNELLVHEQNHRVKNNLQVISSMLNIQANMAGEKDISDTVREIKLRIDSMIQLQKQLYGQELTGYVNLREIVVELVKSAAFNFNLPDLHYRIDFSKEELDMDHSMLFALIINELITNACKYAFRDIEEPVLYIMLTHYPKSMILEVRDNGRHPITDEKVITENTSFGFKMIHMLLLQVDGRMEYTYDSGAVFKIKTHGKN